MWNRGWLLWAWNDNRYIIVVHQIRERYAIWPYMPHLCVLECRSTTTTKKNGVWKRWQKSNIGNSLRWNWVGSRHFVDANDKSWLQHITNCILCFVLFSEFKFGGKLEITGLLLSVTRDNKSQVSEKNWREYVLKSACRGVKQHFLVAFHFLEFCWFFVFVVITKCGKRSLSNAKWNVDRNLSGPHISKNNSIVLHTRST